MTVRELIVALKAVKNKDRVVCCYDEIAGPWLVQGITLVEPSPLYGDEFATPMLSFKATEGN